MRRPAKGFGLAMVAASALAADPLWAESVRIRSGEHDGFTRIVAERGGERWSLGRTNDGYELRLGTGDDFDLSEAFRLIGRTRVSALTQGGVPGSLRIDLGCACHATAFVTAEGALVIDIGDGAPSPDSPFEAPVTQQPAASDPPSSQANTDGPDGHRRAYAASDDALSGDGGYGLAAIADPKLAFFWRGIEVPDGNVHRVLADTPAIPQEEDTGLAARPAATSAPEPTGPHTTPPADAAATGQARSSVPPKGIPASSGIDQGAGFTAVPPETAVEFHPPAARGAELSAPDLPATRRLEAQAALLRELSRAASQGLVEMEAPENRDPPLGAPGTTPLAPVAGETHGTTRRPLAVHAETSVDRDTLSLSKRMPTTAEGGACLSDEALGIGTWGDDRPFAVQIAETRAGLVGEFDRPSPEQVLTLARLYLYFGFGAEARAALRSFDVSPRDGAILSDIGLILDGKPPGGSAYFSDMAGCDTAAALWALMAWPAPPPATEVETGAVVQAFSALPPHLRRVLGPGVSERLIAVGATDAARSVRNAIARMPSGDGHTLDMVTAQVDLASGNLAAGETRLGTLAGANGPLSADALILAVESRLARGEAVEPALADSAEALAFELQDGASGPVLASLQILARASTGEFDRAFAGWAGWPRSAPDDLRAATATRLFAMLAESADDRTFLVQYFRQRRLVDWPAADLVLRLDLADRLAAAGFTGEVRRLLHGEAGYTERGRALLARAALGEYDPVEAMAQVAGVASPVATEVRAEAMAMSGDHSGASAEFRALGQDARAGLEAWRGGNLPLASAFGPEPVRAALESLDHPPAAAALADSNFGVSELGPLASARALVDDSRSTRAAISGLLSPNAVTGPTAAGPNGG